MPIEFACACGRMLRVSEKHAGQQAQCPACGRLMTAPTVTERPGRPTADPVRSSEEVVRSSEGSWRCEVCSGDFRKDEVYDDRGRIICKRCYDAGVPSRAPREPRYRDRYDVPPHVPTHLAEAILVTVLCCLPFGIVSIIFAAQVNEKLARGDYAGARASSQTAATWAWAGFGTTAGLLVLYVLFVVVMIGMGGAFR